MSLNDTPSANRTHIGFFGMRNAGKSSLVNAVTGQEMSVVSDTKGTTTDPVYKAMELLGLGPVMIIDTPGFDDVGELGALRVERTLRVLSKTDIAVLVADASKPLSKEDEELIDLFRSKGVNYIIAYNKADTVESHAAAKENEIYVSALKNDGIGRLREKIAFLAKKEDTDLHLVGDLLKPDDIAVLVTPIDEAAPKGRLILPQQQTIRDILDAGAQALVVKEDGLTAALSALAKKPAMVITDSQVFRLVSELTPDDIPLTSFSVLMARYKGFLELAVNGVAQIDKLKDGDTVLISEGCTHHRQCGDIGSVKLPALLKKYTGKSFNIELSSGAGFPQDLSRFALVIHCGGCMLNAREMNYRMNLAAEQGVPITNYGTAIAYMNGILKRSLSVFPEVKKIIE
ncbi:MAG: [Clostridia bacterium]|nr:[FeFe] hydrogenase H-cluster maturation GTPase HydF [Clostridia bacterium]